MCNIKTRNCVLIFFLIFLISCSQTHRKKSFKEEEKIKIEEEIKLDLLKKSNRLKILDSLSILHNASATFDTTKLCFSFQLQDLLKQNDRIIIEEFTITDIQKYKNKYIVSINEGVFSTRLYVDFECSLSQLEKIVPKIHDNRSFEPGERYSFIVLKITSFKKMRIKLVSYAENTGDDESTSCVDTDASDAFLLKGEFIDIYKGKSE